MAGFLSKGVTGAVRRLAFKYAPPEVVTLVRQLRLGKNAAFPAKKLEISVSVPAGPVLVLAPHPDDEVIGPGGALSLHLKQGDEVTVLYMTNGRGLESPGGEMIGIRRQEAESLGRSFGFKQLFWDVEDTRLTNDTAHVTELGKILSDMNPSAVYLPSFFDHHFDHFAANRLLADALSHSGCGETTIFGYEVWDNMPFPNLLVDISNQFEQKAAMLRHYKMPMLATDFIEMCRYRNSLHYTLNIDSSIRDARGFAEAFYKFDSATFCTVFYQVLQTLRKNGSALPAHVSSAA